MEGGMQIEGLESLNMATINREIAIGFFEYVEYKPASSSDIMAPS